MRTVAFADGDALFGATVGKAPPPRGDGPVSAAVARDPARDLASVETANALTAILLHAEVVRLRATGAGAPCADLAFSSDCIADSARRLWRALGEFNQRGLGEPAPLPTDGDHPAE